MYLINCAARDRLATMQNVTANSTSTQLHSTTGIHPGFCCCCDRRRRAYSSIPRVPVTTGGETNTVISCKTKYKVHTSTALSYVHVHVSGIRLFGIKLHDCLLLQTPLLRPTCTAISCLRAMCPFAEHYHSVMHNGHLIFHQDPRSVPHLMMFSL